VFNDNTNNVRLSSQKMQTAPSGYPDAAQALHRALFGDEFGGYVEFRLISRQGKPPIRRFYRSLSEIDWRQVSQHNSEGFDCYFSVCPRKSREGGKASVASLSTLWTDIDGKDFEGGKPEALSQFEKLPPYLYPSIIVDTGNGYHGYWPLREEEEVEPENISQLEGYLRGLAVALNGDRTFDLSRVLRLPGLLNLKDAKKPRLCHITHWQPDRRFNLSDFDEYWAETMDRAEAGKPRRFPGVPMERSEEFNAVAVRNLIENCAFMRRCRDDAETLSEPHWWAMVHQLAPFGVLGEKAVHQLSQPYPQYTEEETQQKIDTAKKALESGIGPHTCSTIQKNLAFVCPPDCSAPVLGVASPAGLASKLASQELAQRRTASISISIGKGGKQEVRVNCPMLAEEITKEYVFKTFRDTEEIVVYEDGVYRPNGVSRIKEQVGHRLLHLTSAHRVAEVVNYIGIMTYVDREDFNADPHILNLRNGLLDTTTLVLKPHTPEYLSTIRIPVEYDPTADCPKIRKFLGEVLPSDDVPIIEELIGYCLESSYHIHRAFLFCGDGANGKSTLIELVRAFLGKANCSTTPLQAFDNNRFSTASLFGKLANLYADIPSTAIRHVGTFKMLTGGDTVQGEKSSRTPSPSPTTPSSSSRPTNRRRSRAKTA